VAVIDPHGARRPVEVLRGQRLVWIAGIADPSRFASDLAALGAVLVHGAARGDHHRFAPSELAALQARAAAAEAWLITTAKDAARWPAQLPRPAVLEIELAIGGESLLWAPIEAALASGRTATRAR
jgi:tetraacyldisaccharide-1-P 4'-kinase